MANLPILVTAATGTVGSALVRELAAGGHAVRAATRDPARHPKVPGVTPVRFAFDDASTHPAALDGAGAVFLVSPTGTADAYGLVGGFVERAARGGRKIVTMTANGVQHDDAIPLRQIELAVERAGVPFVHLRPGWFMQNFETYWLVPLRDHGVLPLPAAESKTAFIDARDIASAAAVVLGADAHDGRAYLLTGAEAISYRDAAAQIGRAAKRAIEYVPIDDAAFEKNLLAAGLAPPYAQLLVALFGSVRAGHAAGVEPDLPRLLGRAPRTLEAYVNERADVWRVAGKA